MNSLSIIKRLALIFLLMGASFISAQESEMTIEELRALRDELKAKNEALKAEIKKEDEQKNDVETSISEVQSEDVQKNETAVKEDVSVNEEKVAEQSEESQSKEEQPEDITGIKETLIIEKDGYKKKTVILDNNTKSEITTISISDDEKEELEEEVEDLKEKLEEAKEDLKELKEDLKEELEEGAEDVAELKEDLDEAIEEAKEHSKAAFTFSPEVKWLDIDPLKDLVGIDNSLKGKVFDFSNDVMPFFNFAGYADIDGKGLRVGQRISAGYKSFVSENYTGTNIDSLGDTTLIDSLIRLHVIPVSVGFVFEKAFIINPVSFYTGFMLGGGALMVVQDRKQANPETVFYDSDTYENGDEDGLSFIAAPSIDWDLHFGSSVKLTKSFSLGLEGVFNFSYAFYGFGTGHKDYLTWSPGIRLRLGFGNGC